MANWMHNGATNGASTETGAYTLNGVTGGAIPRNPGAAWWIPTGDEWHKAAYYKGGNLNAGYWLYPAQSDNPPGNVIGGSPNQANILIADVYAITQSSSLSSSQNYLTEVGAFTASASAYGTYDQGGNLDEWTGDTNDRSVRGGSWNGDVVYSGSNSSDPLPPELEIPFVGFRLASNMTQSNPDSNGDGIPDAWFAQFPGLSETNEASSTVPGGGATFLEAYIYDVNPTNLPPDFNRVTKPGVAGAIFNFTITHTSVNRQYNVYWAAALGSPDVWTNTVGAYKTGNGSSLGFTVTNTAPGLFYRTGARLPE